MKKFVSELSARLTDVLNTSIICGQWQNVFTVEAIPMVFPPQNIEDLKNISGLKKVNEVLEKKI